jgi:hypothetical protein
VISWDARRDDYTAQSVLTRAARPNLHGQAKWRVGYARPFRIVNAPDRTQRVFSYWAEAVDLERSDGGTPVLVGLFYAKAEDRADPKEFELNIWPLSGGVGPPQCQLGTHYPPSPIFVPAKFAVSWQQLISGDWQAIRTRVLC